MKMSKLSVSARQVSDAGSARTQCAVLPVFAGKQPTATARELDKVLGGTVKAALDLGDFSAERGKTLLLPGSGNIKRVLLVGCGEARKFDRPAQLAFCEAIGRALRDGSAGDALVYAGELGLDSDDTEWVCDYLARAVITALYRYRQTLSRPAPQPKLKRLAVTTGKVLSAARARAALESGTATGAGVNAARELANLPGNICTPDYLAREARKLGRRETKLTTRVLNEKQMQELGMGSLLSVSAGSEQPARLIVMEYRGAAKTQKPYVLVGKGITFDSGGISLKPGAKMDEMKYDMGGAASVFGTVEALCALDLPINVVAIIAAAENMPSGRATKPGDVVTSMAGKTIEVLNTDAEGRLVLCDALTYAQRYKPAAVVDIATLTGACVVALGSHATGLYANDDSLAEELLEAGTQSHDRAWRMPLWDDYQKQLQSNFADMANIGGPEAGSVTAACFLARFAEDYRWAHLDIAGSAWNSSPKGATGRPVPLLTRYLRERAGQR
jgi:leucyl aminopeptidase